MSRGAADLRGALRLALRCLAAGVCSVAAWSKDGHEAIGMTTMSALDQETATEVKHLMAGRDAVDVAAWAHKVNKKYPTTVELHFQPQPDDSCARYKKPDFSDCPENRCLLRGIKHFYGHLVNKSMVSIEWPKGVSLTDADHVKYLVNLIGDLHQPMHFAQRSDNLGRNLTVSFRGEKMSLFDLWDGGLTQAVMKDNPAFWWGGWTHVQRTRVEFEIDGARWKQDGVLELERWADESAKYVCENIYMNPLTGKRLVDGVDRYGVVRIDENLFQLWKREMLSKMLVAGARTAIVLNAVLQHREKGHELHGGSSVQGVEDDAPEQASGPAAKLGRAADMPHAHHTIVGMTAAAINLGIFITVGGVFLQIMRTWQGRDLIKQADKEKQSSGGKKI